MKGIEFYGKTLILRYNNNAKLIFSPQLAKLFLRIY